MNVQSRSSSIIDMYPSLHYFQNVGASSGASASTPFGTSSVFFTAAESRAMGCTSDYSKRYLLYCLLWSH